MSRRARSTPILSGITLIAFIAGLFPRPARADDAETNAPAPIASQSPSSTAAVAPAVPPPEKSDSAPAADAVASLPNGPL